MEPAELVKAMNILEPHLKSLHGEIQFSLDFQMGARLKKEPQPFPASATLFGRKHKGNVCKIFMSNCLTNVVAERVGEDKLCPVAPGTGIIPLHLPLTSIKTLAIKNAGYINLKRIRLWF